MKKPDLSKMSLEELKALARQVQAEIASFEERRRKQALAEVETVVKSFGFSVKELLGAAEKPVRTRKGAPKYRNPENPSETWTGRGRQPRWMQEALAAGKSKEDFAI